MTISCYLLALKCSSFVLKQVFFVGRLLVSRRWQQTVSSEGCCCRCCCCCCCCCCCASLVFLDVSIWVYFSFFIFGHRFFFRSGGAQRRRHHDDHRRTTWLSWQPGGASVAPSLPGRTPQSAPPWLTAQLTTTAATQEGVFTSAEFISALPKKWKIIKSVNEKKNEKKRHNEIGSLSRVFILFRLSYSVEGVKKQKVWRPNGRVSLIDFQKNENEKETGRLGYD